MVIADIIKTLLNVTFCGEENPERAPQEQAYIFFCDFLDECEGIYIHYRMYYIIIMQLWRFWHVFYSYRWRVQLHT